MSEERNKSYRIRTSIDSTKDYCLNVNINQDFDVFEILSLKVGQEDTYKLHNSDYGVIVGRVVANNGFGVPNAKVSVFISADTNSHSDEINYLYPYSNLSVRNDDGIRYNLLPNKKVDACHKAVGTFPNKTYLLDNGVLIEVFDEYYALTTRTNEAGDYMFCGVPTGNVTIHMDCDLSDCGILSQRPRDMVYKGYNINQFESANEFKSGTALDSLRQILSQDKVVYVNPFWGNDSLGETIGITRCDIDLNYKFEPTCVFIGSVIGDSSSNGLSKKCVPTNNMGAMEEMVTGQGRIEMIRKTAGGSIESFSIKGTQLIDGNGTWCYQIPMNLDYVMTDEYGNIVPTDDPSKGIPTRASVRFRVSLLDFDGNSDTYLRAKILVPHNPADLSVNVIAGGTDLMVEHEDYDYAFGDDTRDESFRDLLWNNVYTVKQYIPRIQYSLGSNVSDKDERFTGIKACNHFGNNNPMPYNSIRIKLPLMFTLLCALIKAYVRIITILNTLNSWLCEAMRRISMLNLGAIWWPISSRLGGYALESRLTAVADGLCPDLENWYFTPSGYKRDDNGNPSNVYGRVFSSKNSGSKDGPTERPDSDNVYVAKCGTETPGQICDLTIRGTNASKFVVACDTLLSTSDIPTSISSTFFKLGGAGYEIKTNIRYEGQRTGRYIKLYDTNGNERLFYINFDINGEGGVSGTLKREGDRLDGSDKCEFEVIDENNKKWTGIYAIWYDETEVDKEEAPMDSWYDYATDTLNQTDENGKPMVNLFHQTLVYIQNHEGDAEDGTSVDASNSDEESDGICITTKTDYLLSCIEMNLAQEYRVINFDFYNDWVNGVLYFPRWAMDYRPKKSYLFGLIKVKAKTTGCLSNNGSFNRTRKYVQQCSLHYDTNKDANGYFTTLISHPGCHKDESKERCHKRYGRDVVRVFGLNGGAVRQETTMLGEEVYYYKPCEWKKRTKDEILYDSTKVNLFATDLVLLGSLNDCSLFGIPQAFMGLTSSSYKMPTNLALTNMDDSAYLYNAEGGVACSGNSTEISQSGVSRPAPSYKATELHYSSLSGSDSFLSYKNSYDSDDHDDKTNENTKYHDLFPVTEAAGISWNYSGPGQGESVKEKLYYPGGHFLGLSCVNSQTNIKSCINLQRICEVGSSMSQRREVIVGAEVDENNNTVNFSQKYFIPTGFISNDDITGPSFRSMFATMNANRLIANSVDDNTGYKKYTFLYQSPRGFDGMFGKFANDEIYNKKIDTSNQREDLTLMTGGEYGYRTDEPSYDENELDMTYAKTTEIVNKYYYMFRFGLNGSESISKIRSKFLILYGEQENSGAGGKTTTYMALPQYENSYYFYFGLKDGATAFDRFISDFYSQCETEEQETSSAYLTITKNGLDKPSGNSVICNVFNMTLPIDCKIYNGGQLVVLESGITDSTFTLNGLMAGRYEIVVTDRNGITVKANITFSNPDVYASYINEEFTFAVKNHPEYATPADIQQKAKETNSGYFDIDRVVEINGENYDVEYDSDSCNVVFVSTVTKNFVMTNENYDATKFSASGTNLTNQDFIVSDEDSVKLYMFEADVDYDIYVGYRNYTANGYEEVYLKYDTEHMFGVDNMDILVGSKYLSYSNQNDEGFALKMLYGQTGNWWERIGAMFSCGYRNSMWLLSRYLSNQNVLSNKSFDCNVFCVHKNGNICNDFILFGQPENTDSLFTGTTGLGNNYIFSNKDTNKFYGYALNDSGVYHSTYSVDESRPCFGKMLIDDSIPLSDALNGVSVISHAIDANGSHVYKTSGSIDESYVRLNHGCIISDGRSNTYAIRVDSDTLKCYNSELNDNLQSYTIHPLFYFPVMKKPFKLELVYYYWNDSEDFYNNGIVSKCYGKIHNGFVDFDRKFGEAYWYDIEKYPELEIESGKIESRLDFYESLDREKVTEFGISTNTDGTYFEGFLSSNFPSPVFSIGEGVPETVSEIDPSLLDNPEGFEQIFASGATGIVFADKIMYSANGQNTYVFNKAQRSGGASNESAGIKYYAVIDQDVRMPFDNNRCVVSDIENYSNSYYESVLSDANRSTVITDFNRSPLNIGGTLMCIIGHIRVETSDGHVVDAYKFYTA